MFKKMIAAAFVTGAFVQSPSVFAQQVADAPEVINPAALQYAAQLARTIGTIVNNLDEDVTVEQIEALIESNLSNANIDSNIRELILINLATQARATGNEAFQMAVYMLEPSLSPNFLTPQSTVGQTTPELDQAEADQAEADQAETETVDTGDTSQPQTSDTSDTTVVVSNANLPPPPLQGGLVGGGSDY